MGINTVINTDFSYSVLSHGNHRSGYHRDRRTEIDIPYARLLKFTKIGCRKSEKNESGLPPLSGTMAFIISS